MSMSKEKLADLGKMEKDTAQLKIGMFTSMHILSAMDEESLKASGHKDLPSALVYTFEHTREEINKLVRAYIKKWPD